MGYLQLNKRVAQLPIEIEKVFDSKKARVTDGLLVKSVMYEQVCTSVWCLGQCAIALCLTAPFSVLRQLDTVIFVACTALGTFLVSDIWVRECCGRCFTVEPASCYLLHVPVLHSRHCSASHQLLCTDLRDSVLHLLPPVGVLIVARVQCFPSRNHRLVLARSIPITPSSKFSSLTFPFSLSTAIDPCTSRTPPVSSALMP